jgi:hypothetical protein
MLKNRTLVKYFMAKDPVTQQPVANDPGKAPPNVEESLRQASAFHVTHATKLQKEARPNVVHEKKGTGKQEVLLSENSR